MQRGERLLIFGASARAAAFSALRAGLSPWCADLFADADLLGVCPAMRIPGKYPDGFRTLIEGPPPGPWMYTGALENYPALVGELAARRALWGNGPKVLARCRAPEFLARQARAAGLPAPEVIPPEERRVLQTNGPLMSPSVVRGAPGRWLAKPMCGAAGFGVHFWDGEWLLADLPTYLQEFVEGTPASAVYVGAAGTARLLGVTRQLIGEAWLHARPFAYCGNVAPYPVEDATRRKLRRLGHLLADEGGLRGLFGVDGILRDGAFWPVEVNPRYTASVEVVEHATGVRALDLHRRAFAAPDEVQVAPVPERSRVVVGKAILYAPADGVFPESGPWDAKRSIDSVPDFADVPRAGEALEAGGAVLTVLAAEASVGECLARLRERAAAVYAWLGWPAADRMSGKGAGP